MQTVKVVKIKNSILQSCAYILATEFSNDVYLVDCGDVQPIKEYLINNNKRIKGIFLTHSHYDHVYGLNDIINYNSQLTIYCSKLTYKGLLDERINMSFMYLENTFIPPSIKNFVFVNKISNKLKCWDKSVEIFETPGHDDDCLCFVIDKYIFTGDVYNPEFPVFVNWSRSNKKLAIENEKLIKDYSDQHNLIICPGHYK